LKMRRLRIGKIPYMNLFPIFSTLEKTADCSAYDFIDGVPSFVNRLLRDGRIDVSPSSSIEYLRNRGDYTLIEDHSISSFGPIGSIFLFSRRRIEELDGETILTSSQSETSVALLDILLKKFMGITCILKSSDEPLTTGISSFPAYLLIGDDAISAVRGFSLPVFGGSVSPLTVNLDSSLLYIYDLGEDWFRNTHLPFVFALWIARRDCQVREPDLLIKFKNDLDSAKIQALQNLETLSRESPMRGMLSEEEIVSYWKGISYDFTEEHRRGLKLFDKYAVELGLVHPG
jgi:chorismate dehydratase